MISIKIPANIKIKWGKNFLQIMGPLGFLIKQKGDLSLAIKKDRLYFLNIENDPKKHFYLSSIYKCFLGLSKGYRSKLKLVGVGYRAFIEGKILKLKIGYSHLVEYEIPDDIQIICAKTKGVLLLIKGKEKQRVTQVATEIRNLKIPDVYKGKGIHFNKEILKLKKGKKESK
jgi:large subunit ribosomal protein L6